MRNDIIQKLLYTKKINKKAKNGILSFFPDFLCFFDDIWYFVKNIYHGLKMQKIYFINYLYVYYGKK